MRSCSFDQSQTRHSILLRPAISKPFFRVAPPVFQLNLFSPAPVRHSILFTPAMATMDQTTGESTIRVILLDALGLSRASLARFLAAAGFEISGECATSGEVLDVLKRSAADVILLDFDLCADPGEFISTARQAGYEGRFLAISSTVDARKSAIALKLGASGIFLKSEAPDRLTQVIRVVASGDVWIDQKVIQSLAGELVDRDRHPGFNSPRQIDDRERNVLLGILGGLNNRSIGEEMGLSESSVKNVVQRLFHKGGVKTRGQLVRMALEGAFGSQEFLRRQTGQPEVAAIRPGLDADPQRSSTPWRRDGHGAHS